MPNSKVINRILTAYSNLVRLYVWLFKNLPYLLYILPLPFLDFSLAFIDRENTNFRGS